MKTLTVNGVSTTQQKGQEDYTTFTYGGKKRYQYDYRHTDGELFSTVRSSLSLCREERDKWLSRKSNN